MINREGLDDPERRQPRGALPVDRGRSRSAAAARLDGPGVVRVALRDWRRAGAAGARRRHRHRLGRAEPDIPGLDDASTSGTTVRRRATRDPAAQPRHPRCRPDPARSSRRSTLATASRSRSSTRTSASCRATIRAAAGYRARRRSSGRAWPCGRRCAPRAWSREPGRTARTWSGSRMASAAEGHAAAHGHRACRAVRGTRPLDGRRDDGRWAACPDRTISCASRRTSTSWVTRRGRSCTPTSPTTRARWRSASRSGRTSDRTTEPSRGRSTRTRRPLRWGCSLDQAREAGHDAFESTADLATTAKGYTAEAERARHPRRRPAASRTLLGVFVAGPGASEPIHEAVLAVKLRIPLADLADTIHAFPTAARVIGNLFVKVHRELEARRLTGVARGCRAALAAAPRR